MKKELTKEQSQHLIELGVSKEKASLKDINTVFGTTALALDFNGCGAETITTDIEEYRFKLEDFLNGEILPLEIYSEDYKKFQGNNIYPESYGNYELLFRRYDGKWQAMYVNVEEWELLSVDSEELIDAFYQLTVNYYGTILSKESR